MSRKDSPDTPVVAAKAGQHECICDSNGLTSERLAWTPDLNRDWQINRDWRGIAIDQATILFAADLPNGPQAKEKRH